MNSDPAIVSSCDRACICCKKRCWSSAFSRSLTIIICLPNGLLRTKDLTLSIFGGLGSSELSYSFCIFCSRVMREALEVWSSLFLLMKLGIKWRLCWTGAGVFLASSAAWIIESLECSDSEPELSVRDSGDD
jgi:hypothetical protein